GGVHPSQEYLDPLGERVVRGGAVRASIDGTCHGRRRYPRRSCRITTRPPGLRRPAPSRSTSGCPFRGGGICRPSLSACCSAQRCTWAITAAGRGSAQPTV